MAAKKRERDDTPAEPVWVGWVMKLEGANGYVRRKVRIPASWIDDLASGPASGPDLRPNIVAQIQRDSMRDEFLHELSEGRAK